MTVHSGSGGGLLRIAPIGSVTRDVLVAVANGITMNGERQVPGFWLTKIEHTTFEQVLGDLRNRGVKVVLIACNCTCTCVPGGFGDAINMVFR
jgi:hypothetical protein